MDGAFFPTVRPGGSPKVTARNGRVQCSVQRNPAQPSAEPAGPDVPKYLSRPALLCPVAPVAPVGCPHPGLGGAPLTHLLGGSGREASNVWRALRSRPGEGCIGRAASQHLAATAASHRGGTPNNRPRQGAPGSKPSQSWVLGYFGTSAPPTHSSTYLLHTFMPTHSVLDLLQHLSICPHLVPPIFGWVGRREQRGKSDPQSSQGWSSTLQPVAYRQTATQ